MNSALRPYLCQRCGYVLGFVVRGSNHLPRLNVLRVSAQGDLPEAERTYSVTGLEQGAVICAHCGAERTWRMSEAALDDLIARRRGRSFGLAR